MRRQDNPRDETYVGLTVVTDNTLKTRYNGHTSSFRNENKNKCYHPEPINLDPKRQ